MNIKGVHQSAFLDISREESIVNYKSMVGQSKNGNLVNWAKTGQNLNKSEIVPQKGMNLPEKLQKMKERFKRDRSADIALEQPTDKKSLLDEETQRLRDSYNKHRKPTSKSQLAQRNILQKSFKEDELVLRDRSFDLNRPVRDSDKENALRQSSQTENRYKRSQQRSQQALVNYQQKYERLEKNFKKFTNNIKSGNQSEQLIDGLKIKNGLSIILNITKKNDFQEIKWAIKVWRLNSGLTSKQYENQQKTFILAKYAQKLHAKSLNHVKILFYQKWKKIALNDLGPDRIVSKLSEIITNTEDFNRCVENDYYLSQILNEKLVNILGGLISSDMFFHCQDDEPTMKTYRDGEELTLKVQALINHSIIGQMIAEESSIMISEAITTQTNFNREFDLPMNPDHINHMNKSESNAFNKVRGLSLVLLNLGELGILRLFFPSGSCPTNFQLKQVKHLSRVLPDFLQRISDVRTQINSLAISNIDQAQQISMLETFNSMNQHLKGLNELLMKQQSSEEVLQMAKEEIEKFVQEFFDMENAVIRQILDKQELLLPQNKDLVRFNDHTQESKETIEDFLDYKKDYYIHQISICPKTPGHMQFSNYTFIIHIYNKYQAAEPQRDLRDLSTSLNSMGLSSMAPRFEKKYLDDELKHKLAFYLRGFCPILQQNLFITGDIVPRISKLESELLSDQKRYDLQLFLHHFVSSNQVLEEQNELIFSAKLTEAISQAYQGLTGHQTGFCCFLNNFIFHRKSGQFQFSSYMDDEQLEMVTQIMLKGKKKEQYQVMTIGEQLNEVEVKTEVVTGEMDVHESLRILTIFNAKKVVAIMIFEPRVESEVFGSEIQTFLTDFIMKRQSIQNIQDRYDSLQNRLQGEKMTQQTKDLLDEALVLPFLKQQSLKSLGDGIDFLSDKLVQNIPTEEDWDFGQEISQIAFLGPKVYIEEVRLLSSYSQIDQAQDSMIIQSYKKKQQIVYEDDDLDKVILLQPIQSQNKSDNALILRFVLSKDQHLQQKLQNIQSELIVQIQPFISSCLNNGFTKQMLAISKLTGVIDKYRFNNYREIIYFMRDLKSKNVYNFSRSRLYEKIAKSKRYFEIKKSEEQYFDVDEKHLAQNQLIQHMIRQSLKTMNNQAFKFKLAYFKKFVIGTRKEVYAPVSKKRKRAVTSIVNHYRYSNLRAFFSKMAINTQTFKHIRHPKTKYLASVRCLFRNFRIVRERLAFLKLKKNLNMQLRESMASYRESDKDFFIQLNQILVSSHMQQGGLDGGFQYAMGEMFVYLKNLSAQELKVQDLGFRADDGFVGHIDEVVLTMKSQIYTSHGSIASPSQASKTKIFMQNFSQMAQQKNGALALSYDEQNPMSQQEQILSQINASNIDNNFEIDSQREFFAGYQNFEIAQKKDLIHQMLVKSNGVIFNFQNIQQSLSDIFLSQQSSSKDQSVGNRFAIVRRSKSALIVPLFDVSQQAIIGSLELYRHHCQAFSDEIEQRYDFFSKRLADFFLIYGQLKQQSFQIEQLKWQMQKQVRPAQSLSNLLKNSYVNAPGNHFPGATHVLPIIILNQQMATEAWEDDFTERSVFDKKVAFFYQFKDNHIYNFDYEGTFIDELMENGCILEMCQKNALQQDENIAHAGGLSHQTSLDEINQMSSARGSSLGTGRNAPRHRTIQSNNEKVKSVTNDLFKHIIYYPIFDIQDGQKIIAIFEVGFKKKSVTDQIMTDDIQGYLDQFRSSLAQFRVRLNSFSRNLENLLARRTQKRLTQKFQLWKQTMIFTQYKEQFQSNQYHALQNQESCYSEYVSNLDQFNNQLKSVSDEKERLQIQLDQYVIEKKAKLKFLATSLVSSQNLFRKAQVNKIKQAFLKWQYNVSIRKIAETAFSRVLELNHRHSKARFKTAVYLLQGLVENTAVKEGFNSILRTAHMRPSGWQAKYKPQDVDQHRRSRSRSMQKGDTSSYILNNMTSLLSPQNLKKMEVANLYQNQISSFYTPGGSKKLDTSIIQLKPHVTQNSATRSNSKYYQTDDGFNPYSELNISQIEYTNRKRDYSPIVTTSKHDLKKIYGKPSGLISEQLKSHSALTNHKKAHSVENYRYGRSKSDLQKQLYLKQKQLTMLKRQLVNPNKNRDHSRRGSTEPSAFGTCEKYKRINGRDVSPPVRLEK